MRTTLKRLVSNPELSGPALRAFTDYPALEELTIQYLKFVPPWVICGSVSVAESTIKKALLAYESTRGKEGINIYRVYMETIAESAKDLSSLRVSVRNSYGQWDIWNYDQPLTEYMLHHKRSAIQIRTREHPIAIVPVMIKLLAAISTTNELLTAEIDVSSLCSGSSVQ